MDYTANGSNGGGVGVGDGGSGREDIDCIILQLRAALERLALVEHDCDRERAALADRLLTSQELLRLESALAENARVAQSLTEDVARFAAPPASFCHDECVFKHFCSAVADLASAIAVPDCKAKVGAVANTLKACLYPRRFDQSTFLATMRACIDKPPSFPASLISLEPVPESLYNGLLSANSVSRNEIARTQLAVDAVRSEVRLIAETKDTPSATSTSTAELVGWRAALDFLESTEKTISASPQPGLCDSHHSNAEADAYTARNELARTLADTTTLRSCILDALDFQEQAQPLSSAVAVELNALCNLPRLPDAGGLPPSLDGNLPNRLLNAVYHPAPDNIVAPAYSPRRNPVARARSVCSMVERLDKLHCATARIVAAHELVERAKSDIAFSLGESPNSSSFATLSRATKLAFTNMHQLCTKLQLEAERIIKTVPDSSSGRSELLASILDASLWAKTLGLEENIREFNTDTKDTTNSA